uniref:Uncharacterized protein n=1 Tax=Oryza brachyantha TaxID=4533 RepID=J3LGL5_ORYBR
SLASCIISTCSSLSHSLSLPLALATSLRLSTPFPLPSPPIPPEKSFFISSFRRRFSTPVSDSLCSCSCSSSAADDRRR